MEANLVQRTVFEVMQADPSPLTQDGGYEIHPELKGTTFYFWNAERLGRGTPGQVYLTVDGGAKEPWTTRLVNRTTGKVYPSFSVAKDTLIKEASELAGGLNG